MSKKEILSYFKEKEAEKYASKTMTEAEKIAKVVSKERKTEKNIDIMNTLRKYYNMSNVSLFAVSE